ncbi:HD domain-containing protein [Diaminobutyricimonas sp. LJ205]|uniref:5' nucleotidase, NT5C type n=1 Tax=Diaminobutyricimonas sp. LJ205 TaxID=2683590 RepID=UPI0018DFDFEB|nr:HD domain-containing protein [Diaminobutyricimonas sp. LJ205]
MKKILYIDLDNTLVDFPSGIGRLPKHATERYRDAYDDAPGIFSLMDPVPGAIEAYGALSELFDTYILSTSPWDNPSAWQHKVEWVREHLGAERGTPAYKRLILSHHKNLNRGDILIDDRPHNGAAGFDGEWLAFGEHAAFPTWQSVLDYLSQRADAPALHAAITLARAAHAGQTDKLGEPYILHPFAVMTRVSSPEAKIVAILHDVVEDTDVTLDALRAQGFGSEILAAVDAITKRSGEPLAESMARVRVNPIALVVKQADISHNTAPRRMARLDPETRARLTARYEESVRLLGATMDGIRAEFGQQEDAE